MSSYDQYYQQYGTEFGVSPQVLENIAVLESSERPGVVNRWDSNWEAGTPSAGVMQFIEPTFDYEYQQASAARPDLFGQMGAKNWMDPQQQIAATAYAISQGRGSQWATYDRAGGGPVRRQRPTGRRPGEPAQPSKRPTYGKMQLGEMPVIPKSMTGREAQIALAFKDQPEVGDALLEREAAKRAPVVSSPVGGGTTPSPEVMSQLGLEYKDFPRQEGEPVWRWAQRMGAEMWGLENDPGIGQTYGGVHSSPESLHYSGRAIDWGDARNTYEQLQAAYDYYNANRDALGVTQLYWQSPGHYDHLHVGF